jgi:glyoxylase-like metal-dependent hydrolase (beta-lactamase superfamily II)
MLTLNRRTLLKSLGSAAALALTTSLLPRTAGAQANFLDRINGGDDTDPLTPALTKIHVGIRKVSDNLYVLLGAGGNIGLFDGPDGAIVIDSGTPDRAKDVAAAVKIVAKNPPNILINTHFHFDHTGGNEAVHALGCRIIAQEKNRKHLAEGTSIDFIHMKFPPSPEAALPILTFPDHLTLYANNDTLHLVHVARAHTDSDAYILFEKANVLQTGDLFFNGMYPFLDTSNGGSFDGMIAAAERLLKITDDQTKIIPGHGPVGTKADLQTALDMMNAARDTLKPLIASGKTMDDIVAAKPLASFDAKFGKGFLDTDTFTKLLYTCYVTPPK